VFSRVPALLVAASLLLTAPSTAAAVTPSHARVSAAITKAAPKLGKRATATLRADARAARRAGRSCAAVSRLGKLVTHATALRPAARRRAAAPVAKAARDLQTRLFAAQAKRKRYCGVRAPRARVKASLKPTRASLGRAADGHVRSLARLDGAAVPPVDFVADEVFVVTDDEAQLAGFLKRWRGKVIEKREGLGKEPAMFLVRVDVDTAQLAGLPTDLRAMDPRAHGMLDVGSSDGLRLVALAADAAARGLAISPNFVRRNNDLVGFSTLDAPAISGTSWDGNAFNVWYVDPPIDLGQAWRYLRITGQDQNRVKVGVVDGGFHNAGAPDLPASAVGFTDTANALGCGSSNPCPWHGTNVTSTLAGLVDNGVGAFGSAGTVADPVMITLENSAYSDAAGIAGAGALKSRVINYSGGYWLPTIVAAFAAPSIIAVNMAQDAGALVVAAAGNDGEDVDEESCFGVCWEDGITVPCEIGGVVCVGGINQDGTRASQSNYGSESCGSSLCDVDIFGPWATWVGPDGANSGLRMVNGTSFASPFVAGVAADMLAADPKLTVDKLRTRLINTAAISTKAEVSREVRAGAAVLASLPGNKRPFAIIDAPTQLTPPLTLPYGSLNFYDFKGQAVDLNPTGCCSFAWSSDLDGPLGAGAQISAGLSKPGVHTISLKATDATGLFSTATVTVNAINLPPVGSITAPAAGQTLYRGQTVRFEASASDPNEFSFPCDRVLWEIGPSGSPGATSSCQPNVKLTSQGQWRIALTVVDEQGASAQAIRLVQVDPPPNAAPPFVHITKPANNAALDSNVTYSLEATADDPDDPGAVLVGSWSVTKGGTTKALGTGNTITWRPDSSFNSGGSATLSFSATDADGTSTDTINVSLLFPPG